MDLLGEEFVVGGGVAAQLIALQEKATVDGDVFMYFGGEVCS